MIANCGQLGLDWRETSMSAYFEALEAHSAAQDPKGSTSGPRDTSRLARFMEAHNDG